MAMRQHTAPFDVVAWSKQRAKFPEDQLRPHWGRHVAFNADASRALASAPTRWELYEYLGLDFDP